MGPDTKLILSLVNRITVRLPSNSGKKLDSIENDPLVQQTVSALIDLSKYRLPTIATTLVSVVENICKTHSITDEYIPHDVLQSQLFLLRLLSACMQHHWQFVRKSNPAISKSNHFQRDSNVPDPLPKQPTDSLPPELEDPPPLEESLTKMMVVVLSRFMHQLYYMEERENGSTHTTNVSRTEYYTSTSAAGISSDIIVDIYKAASRVIFYLSASNWHTLFIKIKTRILYLTTTMDEAPNFADLRLLECCALNSKRLGAVLIEFCTAFIHLKKSSQMMAAVVLRRAIWGWIETYPLEFVRLCQNQKRLEGGPEVLFDICNSLADTPRKRSILWPLQTMLLVLCPDLLLAATVSESRGINTKKTAFLSTLRKSLKGGRNAELAAMCFVDLCKAATFLPLKDPSIALRHIVPDIEAELKQKLFDPHQPLISDSLSQNLGVIIDHRCLLADSLVAMFKLNPHHVLRNLFPVCFSDRSPTLFKLSVVKACLALTSDECALPWNPSPELLYSYLGTPLRLLFLDVTSREIKSDTAPTATNALPRKPNLMANAEKKKKEVLQQRAEASNERLELILDLLRLYQNDPMLAIRGDADDLYEQNAATMVAMANCLREPNPVVRQAAAECLFKLHSTDAIEEWGRHEQFMEAFWIISSQIVFTIAKQLLDSRERNDSLKKLLDLLQRLLVCRNRFLTLHQDVCMNGTDVRERLQASIGLEVALLILLCSADGDICSGAITCLGHLCVEANITESADDPRQASLTIVENLPIYVELTSNTGIVAGRKSQQKRIRRLLRMTTHHAPGNLAAWEEAWKRWKYMTPTMVRPNDDNKDEVVDSSSKKSSQWHDKLRTSNRPPISPMARNDGLDDDRAAEWQNYAGFLASLGGICLMADTLPSSPASPGPRSFNDPSNTRITSSPSESAVMVEKFIMDMVDLLLCDNVIVREWVMDILGTDLSPALYPIMFRHLENVLGKCFGPDGDPLCSPRYTLFVEQAISVLKLVLDRMEENVDSLFTVDFGGLIDQYAKYLNKLGSSQLALKMKSRFCHLCEVMMAKKDRINIRQEFKLRNKLLEIIVEWTSDFSLNPDPLVTVSGDRGDKFHRDLDLACLKTIVGLLQQLPLQPSDSSHEADSTQVKSRIFYKYFSFFLKLLNRCRLSETEAVASTRRGQDIANINKSKENATYLAPLKDCTILAMSNLLSANVDAGLKYSLSMGYHEDTRMRTAFMQVLTNILNQGTEFENLAETVMTDRYEKLVDMLVESDLSISLSLCDVCPASDVDDVANALLASFASRGKTMVLLKAVIEKEVQRTESETELFRRTSIATRLLSAFAKKNGTEYVQSVLQPIFQKSLERPPEERTYELDSSKVGPSEDVARNKDNVVSSTEMLLNAICQSADQAPRSFREVCNCILASVRGRFPDAKYTAVGAFIFLRFFCPAIASPESEGLIKPMTTVSREMRRGHLMATKVIQNLANNVLFGSKETYMIVLNDFLTNNIYKVTSFLREISIVPPPTAGTPDQETDTSPMDDKSYAVLHRVLADNLERISRDLATRRFRGHGDQESMTTWKRQLDKFSNLLAQLGRPPEIPKQEVSGLRSYNFAASNQLYAEFMRRNSHRSVEPIASKNIFYEGGVSRAGRRIYYFITRNVISDSIDFELLTYYILQTLERATTSKQFELVVDLTLFGPSCELSNLWMNQIIQLLPFDGIENVAAIHMYNPNSYLRKYIKKLTRPISNKLSKRFTFSVTLAELHEHIQPTEVRLPKATTALDTESSTVFYPVNKVSQYKLNIPVTIKVSAEYVQIMTVRKQELLYGVNMVTNDVYHISEIEDITLGRTAESSSNELSFKYNRGKSQLILSTPKRDAVVSAIRHSKRRHEMSKPANISERNIRPNDVPGRLLNMALLNIGSDDPNLRLAAYNLLYSLSMTFDFDVGKQLLDARDLCLPANSSAFIVGISEKIANAEPNLTLEFLSECFVGFNKSSEPLRYLCLDYMVPWLPNVALFCHSSDDDSNPDLAKTKEVIRLLIDLTVSRTDMYKLVQAKIWKTIGKVDDILNLVLDTFIQFSNEHGVGSPQAEAMADTFVTLSNVAVRGKVISRLRKVLQKTSFKPTRTLTEHWTWTEIAVLIRFILMLSFNNRGPVKSYVPEIFHIVSIVVGVGPTMIRASVHGLVVNMIQSLCTSMPLPDANVQHLQMLLTEVSDSKFRLLFGLHKSHANAFTLTPDTMNDTAEPIQLLALESIISQLLDVLKRGAPSSDVANVWRARWMSLVASTAFQFNPAIQPRAFVVLGCLGREEVDDDLLYQILVALRGALAIFNEADPSLVLSIVMCLKNIVESLPSESRYLLPLFWVAVALVQVNNSQTFCMSVELLLAVVRALDNDELFTGDTMMDVLLVAREPMSDVARELDELCGINFTTHFSFAMATVFLKGIRYTNARDTVYQALTAFLDIECKQDTAMVEAQTLGYLGSLLPMAMKNDTLADVLRLAGLSSGSLMVLEGVDGQRLYHGLFEKLDIPDDTTALLLISMLATLLHSAESEAERLILYGLLSEAATAMPEVFSLVYDSLLPKMNQVVLSSNTQPVIESVKTILLAACSDPSFNNDTATGMKTHKDLLKEAGFTSLAEPGFGAMSTNVLQHSKLASEIIERVIA
ncbi:hypothetical protein DM01DRAFT_1403269 [Hesseltinella vesiculosa]|uniref:Ras-GAP domain-containing protein n=1 Tax=Hesseltinella vesiculosa TaxID=101127 RepID=A0A1X2GXL6_9FUNG|nr:hypothetical protein DM01DRAFT_1403269 [Hesseltinella vesiculosa]